MPENVENDGHDLPLAGIKRIAHKIAGDDSRIGDDAVELLREKAEKYVAELTKRSLALTAHAGRKTLKADDIKAAEKSAA